jgi:hypothetical protein
LTRPVQLVLLKLITLTSSVPCTVRNRLTALKEQHNTKSSSLYYNMRVLLDSSIHRGSSSETNIKYYCVKLN